MPDARNRDKQRYCGAAVCRSESKRRSAVRWRKKNPEHHRGPEELERVRAWRTANPGYWRRKRDSLKPVALQDDCIPEPTDKERDKAPLGAFALQDHWIAQDAVIRGLIAHLTDSALQEDIDLAMRGFQKRGRRNPGTRFGFGHKTRTNENHAKTSFESTTAASDSHPVQLGRSPPRATSTA